MRVLGAMVAAIALIAGNAEASNASGIRDVTVAADASATSGAIFVHWTASCTGRIRRLKGTYTGSAPFAASARRPRHQPPRFEPELIVPRQRVEAWFSARRGSANSWAGVFEAKIDAFDDGRIVARCHVPRRAWSTTAPRARLSVFVDLGFPFAGNHPKRTRLSMPRNPIWVSGNRHTLSGHFGQDLPDAGYGFTIDVAAPGKARLRKGRYRDTTSDAYTTGGAVVGFSGSLDHQTGCTDPTGTFTIRSIRFSREGLLRRLTMSFLARCGGQVTHPVSGTFTYRR